MEESFSKVSKLLMEKRYTFQKLSPIVDINIMPYRISFHNVEIFMRKFSFKNLLTLKSPFF